MFCSLSFSGKVPFLLFFLIGQHELKFRRYIATSWLEVHLTSSPNTFFLNLISSHGSKGLSRQLYSLTCLFLFVCKSQQPDTYLCIYFRMVQWNLVKNKEERSVFHSNILLLCYSRRWCQYYWGHSDLHWGISTSHSADQWTRLFFCTDVWVEDSCFCRFQSLTCTSYKQRTWHCDTSGVVQVYCVMLTTAVKFKMTTFLFNHIIVDDVFICLYHVEK